jgi:CheY-like chemotaxis protein
MSTVLLVEHNPTVRQSLKQPLAGDYNILEATCPVVALDVCRVHRDIDVLVCDAELGLVSGMELASLLRAWLPELHTILISDLPRNQWSERQEMELRELPPDDVLILERPFKASGTPHRALGLTADAAVAAT